MNYIVFLHSAVQVCPFSPQVVACLSAILKTEFSLNRTFKNYSDTIESVSKAITAYNQIISIIIYK